MMNDTSTSAVSRRSFLKPPQLSLLVLLLARNTSQPQNGHVPSEPTTEYVSA